MEIDIVLQITLTDVAKADALVAAFGGMAEGQLGAYLEEAFEVFGPAAESSLEAMLDQYPMVYFQVDEFEHSDDQLRVTMLAGAHAERYLKDWLKLLALCGISYAQGRVIGDDDDVLSVMLANGLIS